MVWLEVFGSVFGFSVGGYLDVFFLASRDWSGVWGEPFDNVYLCDM